MMEIIEAIFAGALYVLFALGMCVSAIVGMWNVFMYVEKESKRITNLVVAIICFLVCFLMLSYIVGSAT